MKLPKQLLKRKPDTHKGDYGYVLVIGGSPGLTGAVCLCASASLKIGAGLVRVAVPKSVHAIIEVKLTEVMSLPLNEQEGCLCPDSYKQILPLLDSVDVVAMGCGGSRNPATQKLFLTLIESVDKPMVIDADGLNALAVDLEVLKRRRTKDLVLTPHVGEFSRLTKLDTAVIKKQRKDLVKEFAFLYNLTLVLKGDHSLVSDGKLFYENKTGNPGMAKAGSGDVLTGMIAGLMAQGLGAFEASKYAVYLHGLAGDEAAKEKTQVCLLASDLIEYLPKAIKKLSHC
jgi:ADP-dependent NAD(P)H-hydrate dehydratase / NAD(P)H-hydrate epimerase